MNEYLKSKRLPYSASHHGLRESQGPFNGWKPFGANELCLLVPITDGRKIHSLQFISSTGDKRFYPGGKKHGNFYPIGLTENPSGLYVCEGVATGLTIHQFEQVPVIVAFDANNILPVAMLMRRRYPDITLVIAGDNDHATPGNPGKAAAELAAERSSMPRNMTACILPDFTGFPATEKDTDFNDLAILRGDL